MPTEFRRLTFQMTELREAIRDTPQNPVDPRSGDISSITTVRDGREFQYELNFFNVSRQKQTDIHLSEEDAEAAMVNYCLSNSIPLPREAEKSARLVDQHLCLDIFIGEAQTD